MLKKIRAWFQRSGQWLFASPLHLFVVVGALTPMILVLIDIAQNSVNVPYHDQWGTSYSIATAAIDGSLTFGDLFRIHNEHRIFFTQVVTALSAILLHWNLQVELLVSVLLGGLIVLILIRFVRQDYPRLTQIAIIPFAALVFSFRARRTWLGSFQSCFLFVVLFLLLALWILCQRPSNRRLVLAGICAGCANYSLASGILAWPILLVALPLLGYRKWYQLLFWVITGAMSIFLYFHGVTRNLAEPLTLADIPDLARYVLAYLGAPFIVGNAPDTLSQAIGIGAVSIGLFLSSVAYLAWRQRSLKRLVVWGAIAGFGIGTALLTAYGRLSLFRSAPIQPLSGRYIIHGIIWWVAVIMLSMAAIDEAFSQRRLPARLFAAVSMILLVALIPLGMYADSYSLRPLWVPKVVEDCMIQAAIFPASEHTCFPYTFQDRWQMEPATLADKGLTLFSGPLPNVTLIKIPYAVQYQPEPPSERPKYTTVHLGEAEVPALFEHASALIEYQVHLPATYTHASFHTRVYVDPQNLERDPATPQDGVTFTFAALDDAGNTLTSEPLVFDPHTDKDPIPVTWDLSRFAGQTIRLQLGTDARQNANWDWAYWIEPALTLTSG